MQPGIQGEYRGGTGGEAVETNTVGASEDIAAAGTDSVNEAAAGTDKVGTGEETARTDIGNTGTDTADTTTSAVGETLGTDKAGTYTTWDWFKDLIIRIATTHPVRASIFFTLIGGILYSLALFIYEYGILETIVWAHDFLFIIGVVSAFFIYPVVLTVLEAVFLILEVRHRHCSCARRFDQVALWYGLLLETMYPGLLEVTDADWMVQLRNNELHTPIYSGAEPTVQIIAYIAIAGFCYLSFRPMDKMPPLAAVLSISGMYLGIAEVITYTVQVINMHSMGIFLLLLWPACLLMMSARTILAKVREFTILPMEKRKIHQNRCLRIIDQFLSKASRWPFLALVLAIPLLGIIIAALLLFGQAPDSVVKAWTETANWRLSARQAPQNIHVDEHYLCTVAAGGHRQLVRPTRMGIRHGHRVIVNRQLCVANAFEEVLQEKMPRFHRALRSFYDRYGFPIAKMIRSPWTADLVYCLMKPLEWLFVIVLYLTDVHPENRIAVQYMGDVPVYRH